MGRALKIFAILGWGLALQAAGAGAGHLAQARAALDAGRNAEALEHYHKITERMPEYAEKLTDIVRYQLTSGQPTVAFQLIEIARRLRLPMADLDLYRALAMTRGRVCPAEQEVADPAAKMLLLAHTLRFHARFRDRNYDASPFEFATNGRRLQHLAASQTHYLEDIPRLRLLPGQGCPMFNGHFDNSLAEREREEFEMLKVWDKLITEIPFDQRPPGRDGVYIRLIDLAHQLKDEAFLKELLVIYVDADADRWAQLPLAEGRFIWQLLMDRELKPKPPYHAKVPEHQLVKTIFLRNQHLDYARWLALIDWSTTAASDREKILEHLISLDSTARKGRAMILRAQLYAARGEIPNAIGLLRELLMTQTSEVDSETEALALKVAAEIFSEYRADPVLRAAVQNAVPSVHWPKIFRPVVIDEALRGNGRQFRELIAMLTKAGRQRSMQLTPEHLDMLEWIGDRNLNAFRQNLSRYQQSRRMPGALQSFFSMLAERAVRLTPEVRASLQPVFAEIRNLLRQFIEKGQNDGRMQSLYNAFPGDGADSFDQAAWTVQQGNVTAGVVDLRESTTIPIGVDWGKPGRPPLRDLLPMPGSATARDWIIQ
jgi:hypothetical protein